MKVLFVTRPTVFSGPGGDTVQLKNTAAALERCNVSVDIASEVEPSMEGYDLVHFYNLRNPQDLLNNVRRASSKGIPTVLSTIWGSYLEGDRVTRTGFQGLIVRNFSESKVEYAKVLARAVLNRNFNKGMLQYFSQGHLKSQREIVGLVDVLLPNSPTELTRVRHDCQNPDKPGVVVNNAVDPAVFDKERVKVPVELQKHRGAVLCAARIETRKCQRELIIACEELGVPLVIVGKPSPNSTAYYKECLSVAGRHTTFISHLEHSHLAALYKVSDVHALVSWMETPGLSSLEAGIMGCKLVVTEKGDTRYYFDDLVEYVDPAHISSIKAGVQRALARESNLVLQKRIESEFTWDVAAHQTIEGYRLALKLKHTK